MLTVDAPLPLIPYPVSVAPAPATRLSDATRIVADEDVLTEARILGDALARRTGWGIDVVLGTARDGDIELRVDGTGSAESYTLTTGAHVSISAGTGTGVLWGVQTARQLLTSDADGWFILGAAISDEPRFAYRGVMLDVTRHYYPVADICRYIDAVSAYKINALHLHLTDDQGWRLELTSYPRLTELSSSTAANGDEGGFYTQDDYATIVEYAARRHMTVIPEIDTPGHTHAVTLAYPEFTAPHVLSDVIRSEGKRLGQELPEFGKSYTGWAVGFSSLKVNDPATEEFITEVFREVASITPGPWIHLGGDECLGTEPEDFARFIRHAASAIIAAGKTPIAWHEAGKVADLPRGTIGQYWGYRAPQPGYEEEAQAFIAGGGSLILSPADAAYLDMKYDENHPLGLVWADGPTGVKEAYNWEPSAIISGVADEHILGVEAPLWTETAPTMREVENLVFPRLPGHAEIGWSTRNGLQRQWTSFERRLAAQAPAWKAEGINFHPSEEISWKQA